MAKAATGAVDAQLSVSPLSPLADGESPSPAGGEGQSRALVLGDYRGQPQRRAGRKSDWSQSMRNKFIGALADSCNVSLAARTINRSISNVYKQRTTDAKFRAEWDQALAIGYSQLEMMMLERALHGVEKTIVLKSGETKVMREYSDRVALALLRLHRESAATFDEGVDAEDYQEACARIIERLSRLRERDEEDAAEKALETKGSADRIGLILWGLRRRGGRVDARVPR
jgi:hypothetical protein